MDTVYCPEVDARIRTQRREDLERLAAQAERNGVQILHTAEGEHFATSATDPYLLYRVGAETGCACRGFFAWGRCQHHSLLLAELGLIADDPDVRAEASVDDAWREMIDDGVIVVLPDGVEVFGDVAPAPVVPFPEAVPYAAD